ncbi:MAG: sodium:proton antiporter [Acidobacteriota bacterium]
MLKRTAIAIFILFILGSFFIAADVHSANETSAIEHHTEGEHSGGHNIGGELPIWSAIPFVGILLSIALFPLIAPKFWHHNFGKISFFWALVFSLPFLLFYKTTAIHEILHIYFIDYIPFIILLWALYTVSGGILLKGSIKGNPITNLVMLLIGTLLSSWIGTTGSAMLLIRPIIRSNADRKNKVHIVIFFIFLVANIGGSLTPLGDPPLFLGFLHGVSFFWTLKLIPHMAFVSVILLAVFFALDSFYYKKEEEDRLEKYVEKKREPIRLLGTHNMIFLLGIISGVLFSGSVKLGAVNILGIHMTWENIARDLFLVLMGILSLKTTKDSLRKDNNFTWFPIQEVAILFAGIFMTIIPALAMLKAGAQGPLGFIVNAVKEPWHYFWITGGLSSFLDNAPTYLTFFNTALGQFFPGIPESKAVLSLMYKTQPQNYPLYLKAISAGAVFMGAMTYIGNAPNFMVKSIAEENGIPMPSFFGYMIKYSLIFLVPVFIIVTLVFFK